MSENKAISNCPRYKFRVYEEGTVVEERNFKHIDKRPDFKELSFYIIEIPDELYEHIFNIGYDDALDLSVYVVDNS